MHAPMPVNVRVLPEITQFPEAERLTGNPELAMAFTGNGATPTGWAAIWPSAIV